MHPRCIIKGASTAENQCDAIHSANGKHIYGIYVMCTNRRIVRRSIGSTLDWLWTAAIYDIYESEDREAKHWLDP